jgi:acyl-CoA thioesterase-1
MVMNRVHRPPPGKRPLPPGKRPAPRNKPGGSWQNWLSSNPKLTIAAGLLLVLAVAWLLFPSRYSKVANLDSRGSSIIAFGDSLTAGYGATKGDDYPSKLSNMLGVAVLNAGVSGDTTEDALARLDENVLSRDPRVVLVGLGGNDFLRSVPISTTETNLRTIIRRIQQAGAMVVVLGFRFPSLTASYEKMYERVASEEHCLFIPDLLDGITSDPSLKSDEIHPNGRGYQIMAERISGPARRLIAKANARR